MTDSDDAKLDPKAQMKAALEAKKAAAHDQGNGTQGGPKSATGPQGQQGGKRTFRRKSGG